MKSIRIIIPMMSMIKIESYLIVDKLRVVDDAVDKLSKTFLVKMERVFSQDNDDVDICRMYSL